MHYLWVNFTIYYLTQGSRFELRRGGAEADWLRVCDVFIEVTFSGPDLFQILSIRTPRHHRDIVCSLWSINPGHDDRRSSTDLRRLSCSPQHELSTIDGSNCETRDCLSCTFCLAVNGTILKQTRVSEIYINGLVLQMLRGRIITPHGTLHDNIFLIRVIVKYFGNILKFRG